MLCVTRAGSASQHMRIFQRLICGVWQPTSVDILKPAMSVHTPDVVVVVLSFLQVVKVYLELSPL